MITETGHLPWVSRGLIVSCSERCPEWAWLLGRRSAFWFLVQPGRETATGSDLSKALAGSGGTIGIRERC
jgi:hypothetical protein